MKDENSGCVETYMLTPIWKAGVGKHFSENNETTCSNRHGLLETSGNQGVCKVWSLISTNFSFFFKEGKYLAQLQLVKKPLVFMFIRFSG